MGQATAIDPFTPRTVGFHPHQTCRQAGSNNETDNLARRGFRPPQPTVPSRHGPKKESQPPDPRIHRQDQPAAVQSLSGERAEKPRGIVNDHTRQSGRLAIRQYLSGTEKYAAAYNSRTDTVALSTTREGQAASSCMSFCGPMKAIKAGWPAAVRMRALFKHVQKSGKVNGQYGMSNLDEFVAEAFTNPKFQEALKGVPAPAGSTLKSAWQWFVNIVARVLGFKTRRREDGARPNDDDRGAVDAGECWNRGRRDSLQPRRQPTLRRPRGRQQRR